MATYLHYSTTDAHFFLNKILIHIEGLKFYLYFLDVKYCGLLSKVSL